MSGEFYCEACKETFEKGRSDEETMKEFLEGDFCIPGHPLAVICEVCFQILKGTQK